jgi:hypothetical protein
VERFAELMDGAFRVPGTGIRAGLDGVIGMVPVVGDLVSAFMATFVIYHAWKLRVRGRALAEMAGWVLLDMVVGQVPVAGDVADFFIRSNTKNVEILRRELALQREAGWGGSEPAADQGRAVPGMAERSSATRGSATRGSAARGEVVGESPALPPKAGTA